MKPSFEQGFYAEIKSLLHIRELARMHKQWEIADALRMYIEATYQLNIIDTERAVSWTWKR